MIGTRMIMESSVLDAELLTVKKRIAQVEEQVRMLTAANLALTKAIEDLHRPAAVQAQQRST
jgi:cell division protein FtsB